MTREEVFLKVLEMGVGVISLLIAGSVSYLAYRSLSQANNITTSVSLAMGTLQSSHSEELRALSSERVVKDKSDAEREARFFESLEGRDAALKEHTEQVKDSMKEIATSFSELTKSMVKGFQDLREQTNNNHGEIKGLLQPLVDKINALDDTVKGIADEVKSLKMAPVEKAEIQREIAAVRKDIRLVLEELRKQHGELQDEKANHPAGASVTINNSSSGAGSPASTD